MRNFALLGAMVLPILAQTRPNALNDQERKDGFTQLFDGNTFANFTLRKTPDTPWWVIEDGWIRSEASKGADWSKSFDQGRRLRTLEAYRDFDLRFDFKIAKEGNSGVKYRLQGFWSGLDRDGRVPDPVDPLTPANFSDGRTMLGFEYQITDDENAADALDGPSRASAALYKIVAAKKHGPVKAGTIHSARIMVNGTRFEHWSDGERVAEGDLASDEVRAVLQSNRADGAKKLREGANFRDRYNGALEQVQADQLLRLEVPESPIDFTHHNSGVWFRNIRIKRLR